MKERICLSMIMGLCCLGQLTFGLTVTNPGYQVETYLTYDASTLGRTRDFTFDSAGNIYVVHTFRDSARNGSIQKIGTDKSISTLRSDLVDPRYITWGGGTNYGDYLYVTDRQETANWTGGEITRIDLAGNKTPFAGGLNQPGAITIDPTGKLYVANSADDKILTVGTSGGTATTFSNYPHNISGAVYGLAIDTTGSYGGDIFAGTYSSNLTYAGLFSINDSGIESRYTDFEEGACIAFDDTAEQYFGGSMFAGGRDEADNRWTLYQVNSYNDAEIFGTFNVSPYWTRPDIEFGPDGAMYVLEWDSPNETVVISRITAVPEPATLLLLSVGGLMLRKRK